MAKYGFQLEQEVTVVSRKGRSSKDGVVSARRRTKLGFNKYWILYHDDTAETEVAESRIHPKGQLELT